jgi:hypothetical protein
MFKYRALNEQNSLKILTNKDIQNILVYDTVLTQRRSETLGATIASTFNMHNRSLSRDEVC